MRIKSVKITLPKNLTTNHKSKDDKERDEIKNRMKKFGYFDENGNWVKEK